MKNNNKLALIGVGDVGSAFCFSLIMNSNINELCLIDINEKKIKGEAIDLQHATICYNNICINHTTSISEGVKDANIIVITAGVRQRPGESRLDLVKNNVALLKNLFKDIMPNLKNDAVILMVSNPVDILTYFALKISNLPKHRVIGSGTLLDSLRLRVILGQHLNLDPKYIHAYLIGEHGDNSVPIWSKSFVGGMQIADYLNRNKEQKQSADFLNNIYTEARDSAATIIKNKGYTSCGIAAALTKIVNAVINNEHSILCLSTLIENYYGMNDICLSMPCIINRLGVEEFLSLILSKQEEQKLLQTYSILRECIDKIKL